MEGGEESWKGGFTAEREGLVGGGLCLQWILSLPGVS